MTIKTKNNILFAILIFLNLLDFFTTKVLVDAGGFEVESNPILRYLMTSFNTVWAIMVMKVTVLTMFWYYMGLSKESFKILPPSRLTWVIFVLIVFFAIIVFNNIALILYLA